MYKIHKQIGGSARIIQFTQPDGTAPLRAQNKNGRMNGDDGDDVPPVALGNDMPLPITTNKLIWIKAT